MAKEQNEHLNRLSHSTPSMRKAMLDILSKLSDDITWMAKHYDAFRDKENGVLAEYVEKMPIIISAVQEIVIENEKYNARWKYLVQVVVQKYVAWDKSSYSPEMAILTEALDIFKGAKDAEVFEKESA